MNKEQLLISVATLALLLFLNQWVGASAACAHCPGGLPWYGWASGFVLLFGIGFVFAQRRGERAHKMLIKTATDKDTGAAKEKLTPSERRKYDLDGPAYPHPVIITDRCIGCHACIDSCPHDVLTVSYTDQGQPVASVVDHDLCVEDTSCESACPVSPKACVVVNTTKPIRSLPAPKRDQTYMTSVAGVYVIGDVSGSPLIKNAANEGAGVVAHIAHELRAQGGDDATSPADYDVAIIGAGPAGLSAAIMAQRLGLRYVAVEQDTVMSTIDKFYPKGKYVYFKPETMPWAGAIHLPGLEEYVEEVLTEMLDEPDRARAAELLAAERAATEQKDAPPLDPVIAKTLDAARKRYQALLDAELAGTLDEDGRACLSRARGHFAALLAAEEKCHIAEYLAEEQAAAATVAELAPFKQHKLKQARHLHGERLAAEIAEGKLADERYHALTAARRKVAGDQREVLLNTWRMNRNESGIKINEYESCTGVTRAADGDYFTVETMHVNEKTPASYKARRVVLAIGAASSPRKLPPPVVGKQGERVMYRLSDPTKYQGLHLVIIGDGNSAVEAAVDLAAWRDGEQLKFREGAQQNRITMLIRSSDFKTDVKFGNKQQLYRCIDRGLINLKRDVDVTAIHDGKIEFTNLLTGARGTVPEHDALPPVAYVFAFIGSNRPAELLLKIGTDINW